MSALATAQSGRPFTPRVSTDNSNTGNLGGQFGYDRPNEVAHAHCGHRQLRGSRVRDCADATPSATRAGTSSIGPSFVSIDTAVVRTVGLGGPRRLELRVEIYNLLNRTNLDLPDSFVDRPTFGQSLSADRGRLAQLAARFLF